MISAKKSIPELDERTESQTEQLAPVEQKRLQNLVKLLIMMLLTYVVIFM
jgi:hypothetical protein